MFKMMENMEKKFDHNTNVIVGKLERINATMASMSNKLCHCADKSPVLGWVGMRSSPFELEYAMRRSTPFLLWQTHLLSQSLHLSAYSDSYSFQFQHGEHSSSASS
jgi:hypothetical protein